METEEVKKKKGRPKKRYEVAIDDPTKKSITADGDRNRVQTTNLVTRCSRMLLLGQTQNDVIDYCTSVGYADDAKKIYLKAKKKCISYQNRSVTQLVSQNVGRLEEIIDDCMSSKKYDTALKAIDLLNKAGGVYQDGSKVQVLTQDSAIQITFGGG